ncbi:hypothetical protein DFH06DRAFT_1303553 [Mycena polygramma]|nr:hypothetical protein DFH06DRAFT_1303553 [Mycena polygramma]
MGFALTAYHEQNNPAETALIEDCPKSNGGNFSLERHPYERKLHRVVDWLQTRSRVRSRERLYQYVRNEKSLSDTRHIKGGLFETGQFFTLQFFLPIRWQVTLHGLKGSGDSKTDNTDPTAARRKMLKHSYIGAADPEFRGLQSEHRYSSCFCEKFGFVLLRHRRLEQFLDKLLKPAQSDKATAPSGPTLQVSYINSHQNSGNCQTLLVPNHHHRPLARVIVYRLRDIHCVLAPTSFNTQGEAATDHEDPNPLIGRAPSNTTTGLPTAMSTLTGRTGPRKTAFARGLKQFSEAETQQWVEDAAWHDAVLRTDERGARVATGCALSLAGLDIGRAGLD